MNRNLFYRSFEIERAALDKESRSVQVSFSSETPVRRWYGNEYLLHGDGNVNLSRLRSMGSALMNHNPEVIVGRVSEAKIDGKRGIATIIFDDDDDGNRAMRKVESGSLRGVSVGYGIEKYREVREGEEWEGIKGPAYIAMRWTPYEISLTPIPADHTVGVGRDATRSLDGIEIERSSEQKEQNEMTLEELKAQIDKEREESARQIKALQDQISNLPNELRRQAEEDAKPKVRVTPDEYSDLLSRANAVSPAAVIEFAKMVGEGQDARAIEKKLFDLATGTTDARGSGGTPPLPGKGGEQAKTQPRSIKDMDDETFIRGLTNPSAIL